MLSYLHGFHAGNAADVLKHSLLVFCLSYLKKKEKPLLCVDTHAGAGFYPARDSMSGPNREWEKGFGLLESAGKPPPMIEAYVKLCDTWERRGYPGSPAIMAKMLGKKDRLVCFELHPRELETLKLSLADTEYRGEGKPLVETRREDGPAGLKSLLPPPSRRGLVLIDPSWEQQSEYESIPRSVQSALKRFPEGTFIVWYPLLSRPKEKSAGLVSLSEVLFSLAGVTRCRAELRAKVPENSPRGMYGSGLVIFNPPWTLNPALEESLPYLANVLGGGEGSWQLDWKEACFTGSAPPGAEIPD